MGFETGHLPTHTQKSFDSFRRNPQEFEIVPARPDGKLLILNNPLDQSALVDCGLSMWPMTAAASPFMLQNVGTY